MYRCVPSENGAVHIRNCSGSKSKRVAGEGAEDARDFFYLSLEKDKRKKKMK